MSNNIVIIGAIVIGDNKYSTLLKNCIEKKSGFTNIELSNARINDLLAKLKSN